MEFTSEYISGDAMKIFILFHGFGNVGNFAILKDMLRGFYEGLLQVWMFP